MRRKGINGFVHSPNDGDEKSSNKPDWPKHDFNTTRLAFSRATKEPNCGRQEEVDAQQDYNNCAQAKGDDNCEGASNGKFLNFRFLCGAHILIFTGHVTILAYQ